MVVSLNCAAKSAALSPAGYKVLVLLKKGCAYQVRGAWRFRGLRSRVKEPTLLALLAKGLAERVETTRFSELRITPTGRYVNGVRGQPPRESEAAEHGDRATLSRCDGLALAHP